MSESEIRNIVCATGKQLLNDGLVVRTWGNVSHRLNNDHMVITPSGKLYDQLEPEDMVVVNLNTFKSLSDFSGNDEYASALEDLTDRIENKLNKFIEENNCREEA